MGGKNNRNKSQTPRRKSSRKSKRTLKGKYYDEQFGEFSGETHVTGSLDVTPPIAPDLDTTRVIEQQIANDEESNNRYEDLEEDSLQFLCNVYDLLEGYRELEAVEADPLDMVEAQGDEVEMNKFVQNDASDNDVDNMVVVEKERKEEVEQVIGATGEFLVNEIDNALVPLEEVVEKQVEQVVEVAIESTDNDIDDAAVLKKEKERDEEVLQESRLRENDNNLFVLSPS